MPCDTATCPMRGDCLPPDIVIKIATGLDAIDNARATCRAWRCALGDLPTDVCPLGFPLLLSTFRCTRSLDFAARGHGHSLVDEDLVAACEQAGGTLQSLSIGGAFQLSAASLQTALSQCAALTHLSCRGATVTDEGLARVQQLASLETLDLRGCMFLSGGLLPSLQCVHKLRHLDLGGCRLALNLNPQSAEALATLTQLTHIDLSCNGVDDGTLHMLARLPNLRSLSLGHCPQLTDAGLLFFAESGSVDALEALDLTACTGLGEQLWLVLARMLSLTCLVLAHLPQLLQHPGTVDAMPAALWRLPRLRHLSLAGSACHPSKLKLIAASCGSSLRSLDLSTCGSTGAVQDAAATGAPQLVGQPYRRLSARHMTSLCEAAEHLCQLRELSAAGTRLPLQACLAFMQCSPWIESLDLSGCCLEQEAADDSLGCGSSQVLQLSSSGTRRRLDFHFAAAALAQHARSAGGAGASPQQPATAAAFSSALGCLDRLRRLCLAHASGLTKRHLACLGQLDALTELRLAGAGRAAGDVLACRLAELPALLVLDLSSTALGDGGMAALGCSPALKELFAGRNRGVTSSGIIAFAGGPVGGRSLRSLDLSMVGVVDDDAAAALAAGCPRLRCLRLTGCSSSQAYHLTPAGVAHLAALTALSELSLGRCPDAVTDASLAALSRGLTNLTRLSLAESQHLTLRGLAGALPLLRCLAALDLTCCLQLADDALRAALPGLTHANVQLPQGGTCPTGSPLKRRR